jgi:FkbM family methyltransferase
MHKTFYRVYSSGRVGLKRAIKSFAERITNTHILKTLPRGVDLFFDLRKYLPTYRTRIVFDVGANIGESARSFQEHFPGCTIHCFEPASAMFEKLTLNMRLLPEVQCFRLAMGNSNAIGRLRIHPKNTMSRLEPTSTRDRLGNVESLEEVEVQTLDSFCEEHRIPEIDFLKVDTEGHDLAVIEGANRLLSEQSIGLVQLEAGMNRENTWHVPFHKLHDCLEDHGYRLFALYEQKEEWPTKAPHLRRCNSVYISRKLARANTPDEASKS